MKIHCVGGGPAGLYLGILLKAADSSHDITIFERNRPRDTEGWGVVFSAQTCAELAKIDPDTYGPVARELVWWDTISVHAHGKSLRTSGHGFCGIGRDRFTQLLRERAEALGVTIRFETPVSDPEPLRSCDLLVAADGVHSAVRTRWEQSFRPSREAGACRYIWLGTRKRFETFTFAFRESAHGVFQVHAYPFSADTSTFIVECHEETWRRAGLDVASEAYSAAYCEELFADELEGHPLLTNRSQWIRFDTLRNERWYHDNVVLVGDAAHTAHFSIGSGTRLALEDATALADAIRSQPSVAAALQTYEAARKPRVERMQEAADHSRRWFETTNERIGLPLPQLAFSLMTRTPKLGADGLRKRDADYVAATGRWFADAGGADGAPPTHAVPFDLAGLHLEGRTVRMATAGADARPEDAALFIVPVGTSVEEDVAAIERLRRQGARVAARLDRTGSLAGGALIDAVRAAMSAGCDALELWVSPSTDLGEQLELVDAVQGEWRSRGPLLARWDASDGVDLARALGRRGVSALHVPGSVSEHLRIGSGLATIAIAPDWSDDDVSTALLAGRADLVER